MEQQFTTKRRRREFDYIEVKEHVVSALLVSAVLGVVGFVAGTWKRVDDFNVSHRALLDKLDEKVDGLGSRIDHHTYRLDAIDDFHDKGPRFTLSMGNEVREECKLIRNDLNHWIQQIKENSGRIDDCKNLNLNHNWKQSER